MRWFFAINTLRCGSAMESTVLNRPSVVATAMAAEIRRALSVSEFMVGSSGDWGCVVDGSTLGSHTLFSPLPE
jgi:hypothetical protein